MEEEVGGGEEVGEGLTGEGEHCLRPGLKAEGAGVSSVFWV